MIAVTINKSAGNGSVGSMWSEVYICKNTDTFESVLERMDKKYELLHKTPITGTITIQIVWNQE